MISTMFVQLAQKMYSALSGESVDTEPTTHRPSSFVFREQTFFVRMKGGV